MSRVFPGLLALVILAASGACSDSGQSAEDAADKLATALSELDLSSVRTTQDGAAAELEDLVEPLAETPVAVDVESVGTQDDRATVTLAWRWDLDGREWSYSSTAELLDRGETWALAWQPSVVEPSLEPGEQLAVARLAAERGDILGAGGQRIVTERPVLRYGLDKARVSGPAVARSARRIAQALDLEVAPYVERAEASGERAFVEAVVLRQEDAREQVPATYGSIKGAVALSDEIPLAPTRDFAGEILGTVGEATAEIIEDSDGEVAPGDVVGLSGLQDRYDDRLSGEPGTEVTAVPAESDESDAAGVAEPRTLFRADPRDGQSLVLTLDVGLQQQAERILADSPATRDPASAIVAVRPSTGDILVAANGPGNGGLNAATFGQYAPGSTFKVVSSLALLRAGLTPSSTVPCPPTATVDGREFENYDDYPPGFLGDITLRQAVAHSCNTAFISQADRLGRGDLVAAAASLGLGVDHDLGFPAYFGQVPPPETETGKAADLIGQGTVLASPMAMATVAASVQAGRTVLPRLVEQHEVEQQRPEQALTRQEARALQGLMRAVVAEGSGAFLADVGVDGAKTGTAEHGEAGRDGSLPTHAWMIATRDDLAVAVFVGTGESGSRTAGPLLEAFLR